jgi:outer membrane protein assembly factor BamB
MRALQNSLRPNLLNRNVCAAIFALALISACSGRNIHKDLSENTDILVRQWSLPTRDITKLQAGDRPNEFSNAFLHQDTLVFGSRSAGLVALYPTINQQRWVLPISNGVVSELTIDRGAIFFGGGDGFLYSVDFETGRVNWRYDVRNPVLSRPTVSAGRVFVTSSDDTVYAFDAGTGKWLWHYRRRSSQSASIFGASAPVVDGNEVIAGLSDGFLVALSLQDGTLKWERKLHQGSKFTDVDADPVLDSGTIYVPSYDGALYAVNRQSGTVLWRFDSGASKPVSIEGSRIYLPSSDGNIYALQKESAKVLWKFELDSGSPTRIIVTDRYVIVGSTHQYLYVLDKNNGQGLYRYNVGHGSGFSGSPAYDAVKQRVYFLSGLGNMNSFSIVPPARKARPRGKTSRYEFFRPL